MNSFFKKKIEIDAYTESGKIFKKLAFLRTGPEGLIISFGWPCEYYVHTLMQDYPFDKPICIDMSGRNHGTKDSESVYVSAEDVNKSFKELGLVEDKQKVN